MSNAGNLIVIEGLDASGKATQAARLTKALRQQGRKAVPISFPDYESPSSTLVRMYLAGDIGDVDEVNAYAASGFYAADRYISYMTCWKKEYAAGHTIVADRYTTSNAVHQMAKLPMDQWDAFLDWLYENEFVRMGLPRPDLVLYLDLPPDVSRQLMKKRYAGDRQKEDIHERNLNYQINCRRAALYAANRLGWQVVKCCSDTEPLSVDAVGEQIWNLVHEYRL